MHLRDLGARGVPLPQGMDDCGVPQGMEPVVHMTQGMGASGVFVSPYLEVGDVSHEPGDLRGLVGPELLAVLVPQLGDDQRLGPAHAHRR